MQKLILNDKTEIVIENGASLGNIRTIKNNVTEVESLRAVLKKKDNLKSIQFKQDDTVVATYSDLILISPMLEIYDNHDGKLTVQFGFREKTEIEKRIEALEESQTIQDGAIADLGSIIGELSI